MLYEQGHRVSGSDLRETARTRQLKAAGIPVRLGHDDADAHLALAESVVFSSAIPPDNVELRAARRRSLPLLHRQEVLAELLHTHRSIAVAGTHGKTTTSAMAAALLLRGGRDPSYLVGAPSPSLGGHACLGRGPWLVAEIDESDGHFTRFYPEIAVVCNVEPDHLNHYGSRRALEEGFRRFVSQSRRTVLSADDPLTPRLLRAAPESLTFGVETPADLMALEIEQHRMSSRAELVFQGERIGELELAAPGRHNVANALAALLAGHLAGLEFEPMLRALRTFRLPERRFQVLEENGRVIVDDYAHLPTQIEVNLAAVRTGWSPRRVIAVFQPHRYSRMSYLNGQFARAFGGADIVIVSDIYPAFERPIPGVDARMVVGTIAREHENAYYLSASEDVYAFLSERSEPGDFIIGFGPGDIWQVLHRVTTEGAP